jgi:TRAP-type transport system periplasmic protein
MCKTVLRFAALCVLLPFAASAEPITLKLSFFTSDRSVAYQAAVKPFVGAINTEGESLLKIEVYLSGALGKVQNELPKQVLDGTVDIAFVVPGQNPERSPITQSSNCPACSPTRARHR